MSTLLPVYLPWALGAQAAQIFPPRLKESAAKLIATLPPSFEAGSAEMFQAGRQLLYADFFSFRQAPLPLFWLISRSMALSCLQKP